MTRGSESPSLYGISGHLQEESSESAGVLRMECVAVHSFVDQVHRAAATSGHEDRQAGGHRLVDDQTPLLGAAAVNERPRQAVVAGQVSILHEPRQQH